MALSILGGLPLPGITRNLLTVGMFVLLSLTVVSPQPGDFLAASAANAAAEVLMAARVVVALCLLWAGHRGWRGLQRRPHPFLPN
ncbi:MAG: hypothetical protein ABI178_04110 [Rhodanobacter sp.]